MKATKLEEVTHTYCDRCQKDITNANKYITCDNQGNEIHLCMGNPPKSDKTCEEIFMFKKTYLSGDRDFA